MAFRTLLFSLILVCLSLPATANEGVGLISGDINGALPKGLWRKQPRSEINFLLKNMPADGPSRSIQTIKRNMLLSNYDTSLIDNDIEIKDGEDFLTLRLQKLMEMGLWEDAFTLYTKTTEDPGEKNKLAQIGLELVLLEKGISTACLEAKVLSPRFPDTDFWQQIDKICDAEINESKTKPEFKNNPVLNALYTEDNFIISAINIEALEKLSFVELALLVKKEKIKYPSVPLPENIPPHLLKTFLIDPTLPDAQRESLTTQAYEKSIVSESQNKNNPEKEEKEVENLSQNELIHRIKGKLSNNALIEEKEAQKLAELAPQNPENYFYIQILKEVRATKASPEVSEDQLAEGINELSIKSMEKVNFLKTMLDKEAEFSNNRANVYEKQLALTPDGAYVMPTGGLTEWLKKTQENQLVGLSLLIVLSNIENDAYAKKSGDNPEKDTENVLKSLSTVGLIDQAHLVAREKLASLMGLNT